MLRTISIFRTNGFEKLCGNLLKRFNSDNSGKSPRSVERHLGFTYYPRFPGVEDPPIVPSKLFMVQLIKSTFRTPWWDRKRLNQLGINPRVECQATVIVKNTPEMCAALWKVKHLVRITPITFPNGEPTKEDLGATYLNTQGQFLMSQKYKVDPDALQAGIDLARDPKKLDRRTKTKDSRLKWARGFDLD